MARILTDESTLTRKLKSLSREDRLLSILSRVEAVVAGLLLLAGIAWYFMKGGAGLLVVGIVAVRRGFGLEQGAPGRQPDAYSAPAFGRAAARSASKPSIETRFFLSW